MAGVAKTAEDHSHVLRWAHALAWQVQRLRASRVAVMESHARVAASQTHTAQDNEPFHRMAAEAHFALTAAVQLFQSLRNFDEHLRLPPGLSEREVTALRNALEHWSNVWPNVQRELDALDLDPALHQWDAIGSDVNASPGAGRLGGRVQDELLLRWADAVYDELVHWDPPSPWAAGEAGDK